MTALSQISHDFARLSIPVPKQLAAAQAAAAKFLAAVPRDVGNPIAASLNAIERGDDPFGPEVQREVAMHRLTELNLTNAARLRAEGKLNDAVAANADAILSALANHLEPHAEAMMAAHQLRVTDLADARTLRGAQLAAWGNAASAAEHFAVAHQIVGVLFRSMHRPVHDKLRVLAAATPDKLQRARDTLARDNRICAAWALTTSGVVVSHIASVADLDRRDHTAIDGVVEPLDDTDDDSHPRARAATTA